MISRKIIEKTVSKSSHVCRVIILFKNAFGMGQFDTKHKKLKKESQRYLVYLRHIVFLNNSR